MKKLTLAIALFAFVGTASVNAAAIKFEGEKTEKAEKKEKKAKKSKSCSPGESTSGKKSCCAKKEVKA